MKRVFKLLVAFALALFGAGCESLTMAFKLAEIRRIEEDWGAHKPHKPFIYQP